MENPHGENYYKDILKTNKIKDFSIYQNIPYIELENNHYILARDANIRVILDENTDKNYYSEEDNTVYIKNKIYKIYDYRQS